MLAQFPIKALPLFYPCPYKIMYGGRGGSKTWDFCRALLILGSRVPLFTLCAREIQKSIAESVYRTLVTQMAPLKLDSYYNALAHKIIGPEKTNIYTKQRSRTEFVFAGVKNNITAIKSMEGIDIAAVFEANGVSHYSWETLLPTVRRDAPHGPFGLGSEVWAEFNPELANDESYKRWVLNPPDNAVYIHTDDEADAYVEKIKCELKKVAADKNPELPGAVVIEINWRDNEWFPEFLRTQKEQLRKRDYESYLTVWEGKVRRVVSGAIYAKELAAAIKEYRVSPEIRWDRSRPVNVACDLGRADTCALWFIQQIGMRHHVIDYYGNFGHDWSHYLEQIQGRKYQIGKVYLPHDADNDTIAAPKSVKTQTVEAYPNEGQVIVVERTASVVNDINAVRMMFPRLYFNEEKCADGLQALAHYRYEVDTEDTRDISPQPLHDWASHPADALRCYVMGLAEHGDRFVRPQFHQPQSAPNWGQVPAGQRWMS